METFKFSIKNSKQQLLIYSIDRSILKRNRWLAPIEPNKLKAKEGVKGTSVTWSFQSSRGWMH